MLVRVDYNVPMENGRITDDHRITSTLETLEYVAGAGIPVIATHLGRPKGRMVPELSLGPIATHLEMLIGRRVTLVTEYGVEQVTAVRQGEVAMLENLRFHSGEEENDPEFADLLASMGDLYVNEAFSVSHRAHASTVGIAARLKGAAGYLCEREVKVLSDLLRGSRRPFVAVLGGAKVSDKIGVVTALLDKVDAIIIGGAMSFSFLAAKGIDVGDSLVEPDSFEIVREAIEKARMAGKEIHLPIDVVVAETFSPTAQTRIVPASEMPDGWGGYDIGPATIAKYGEVIAAAESIFWNGPMGVFEWEPFEAGTRGVAEAIARADAYSVVGGGDSAAALSKFGLTDEVDYLSTGGGASLEFIEFGDLPGLRALREGAGGA